MTVKCKIFEFCSVQTETGIGGMELTEKISKQITDFFSDRKRVVTKTAQSSAVNPKTNLIHTYLTVFYKERE